MAYWRRNPRQMQAATDSVAVAPSAVVPVKPAKSPRSRMMRQYDLVERVRSYNPDTNEDLLNRAYVYAMKAHGAQTRASGDPYFSHPLEVAAILTDLKLDDATIVAALLHDTIEDTEATRAEIDQIFGPEIGALVEGLTKLKRLELVSREAKQAENLRKLLLAISDDVRVLLIKLADRLHNMRTLEFVPPTSRHRIAEETLDIYAPLAGRMGMQEMREELEDLSFRTLDPEAHAVVMQRLDSLAERNRNLIGEIESQLSKNLENNGLTAHVFGADLQFDALVAGTDHGGVDGTIIVLFRRRDVVLEAAGYHRPCGVHDAERAVTGLDVAHDHAESEDVGQLFETDRFAFHLGPDRKRLLAPAEDMRGQPVVLQVFGELAFDFADQVAVAVGQRIQPLHHHLMRFGIEGAKRKVFEFFPHLLHAHAAGQRCIDVECFLGDPAARGGRHEFQRAHIVQAVGEFDQENADIVRYREQQLAQVLGLLGLARHQFQPLQLGEALH